jgi:hypothetical protein
MKSVDWTIGWPPRPPDLSPLCNLSVSVYESAVRVERLGIVEQHNWICQAKHQCDMLS